MDISGCTVHMFVLKFSLFSVTSQTMVSILKGEVQFLWHIQNVDQKHSLLLKLYRLFFLFFFPQIYESMVFCRCLSLSHCFSQYILGKLTSNNYSNVLYVILPKLKNVHLHHGSHDVTYCFCSNN